MKTIESKFNTATQIIIPTLTITAFILISAKQPGLGLIVNLTVQPFYIYSAWKSYKQAGQYGLLITAIVLTITLIIGIINYRFF